MNYETVLSLEFPFPKPDMITRLEREEESQNSDEWQFQGGTFAGTMINPIQHPSNGRIMKTNFKFPGTFCGVFKSKARL